MPSATSTSIRYIAPTPIDLLSRPSGSASTSLEFAGEKHQGDHPISADCRYHLGSDDNHLLALASNQRSGDTQIFPHCFSDIHESWLPCMWGGAHDVHLHFSKSASPRYQQRVPSIVRGRWSRWSAESRISELGDTNGGVYFCDSSSESKRVDKQRCRVVQCRTRDREEQLDQGHRSQMWGLGYV